MVICFNVVSVRMKSCIKMLKIVHTKASNSSSTAVGYICQIGLASFVTLSWSILGKLELNMCGG
jgi:hypothetical protein